MRDESRFEIQVDRNLDGIKLEKKGEIEKAIRLYEKNVEEDFEGSHPYDRLAIIYRKRGEYEEEIRVLRKDKAMQKLEKAKKDK
jgi:tetratricopeptide (TPR) repeat protein